LNLSDKALSVLTTEEHESNILMDIVSIMQVNAGAYKSLLKELKLNTNTVSDKINFI